ncbi:DUF1822 family protein [Aerosakkonema sp. BLCC-F183]|uniref:DUF1822 family protein n=1 Tax=Aerosakkonema sp. BLCC-F183 TaxID=3342834 RepID=UPI0035B9CCCF
MEPLNFTVPLGLAAHAKAQQFKQSFSDPTKAKQIYLNTLAVYAVKVYLEYREFETNWEGSDSCDRTSQTFLDVADLVVLDCGKLECRPVLPGAEFVTIPEEVWLERIGYVAVQFNESLREAKILGFVESVTTREIPLDRLRDIAELPEYIGQFRQLRSKPVNLSQWLQNIFDAGWQTLEELFELTQTKEVAFNFRQLSTNDIKRAKLLRLEQSGQQVALLVGLIASEESEIDISVEVYPLGTNTRLPSDLQLILFDETGRSVMQAEAGGSESLEFQFSGEPGESFGVKVAVGDFSITETFLI